MLRAVLGLFKTQACLRPCAFGVDGRAVIAMSADVTASLDKLLQGFFETLADSQPPDTEVTAYLAAGLAEDDTEVDELR